NSDLAIQVRGPAKGASREKRVADVLNGAFDPALLIAASRAARPGVEMIMRAKFKQAGGKGNGVAAPLGGNTFHIVEQNCPWDPAPVLEGVNVAQQEILNALVKEELDPQRARVTERDDETGEFARCLADADLPEMRPIGLRLLARECCQSQESF